MYTAARILAAMLAALMTITTLCGCADTVGSSDASAAERTVKLTVWCAQEDRDMLVQMCKDFSHAHPENHYAFTFGIMSETEAAAEVLANITEAADLFFFGSGQLESLVSAGALYSIANNRAKIESACTAEAISAATVNGKLYGYPCCADTCFLYYDKSKLTDEDVKSLEAIMAKNIPSTKINLAMNLGDIRYLGGFFLGAGCKAAQGDFDFCGDRGMLAGEYILRLAGKANFGADYTDSMIKTGFANGTIAAAISTVRNSKEIKSSLKENYGTAPLPRFTLPNGEPAQLGSIAEYKLIGVCSSSKMPFDAMALAEWLTNPENQQTWLEKSCCAPTNAALCSACASSGSAPEAAAIIRQLEYAVPQPNNAQISALCAAAEQLKQDILSGSVTLNTLYERLKLMGNS